MCFHLRDIFRELTAFLQRLSIHVFKKFFSAFMKRVFLGVLSIFYFENVCYFK